MLLCAFNKVNSLGTFSSKIKSGFYRGNEQQK